MGHLPEFTTNPQVLARLTQRHNTQLARLATRTGVVLVDAAAWSTDALLPRDAFFLDSVHLTSDGLKRLGLFVAQQLAPTVATLTPPRGHPAPAANGTPPPPTVQPKE